MFSAFWYLFLMDENDEQYDGGGWAGDGSGTDDLADDYRDEGADNHPDDDMDNDAYEGSSDSDGDY